MVKNILFKKSFLAAFLFCLLLCNIGRSQYSVWDGITTATSFGGGNGTQADPYLITSAAEFAYFAERFNTDNGSISDKHIKLDANIDLGNHPFSGMAPDPFLGVFDGNNKKIKNLNLVTPLFAELTEGVIKNLIIESGTIKPTPQKSYISIGALVGNSQQGTIENCHNYADVICDANITIDDQAVGEGVGGLVGKSAGAIIRNCTNSGKVESSNPNFFAGGVVGIVDVLGKTVPSFVEQCINFGNIICSSMASAGVIASLYNVRGTPGDADVTIKECANFGNVESTYKLPNGNRDNAGVGGVVGGNTCSLYDCFNVGKITTTSQLSEAYIGGVTGRLNKISTIRSMTSIYNAGEILVNVNGGSKELGTGIGDGPADADAKRVIFEKVFFDSEKSIPGISSAATAKKSSEMLGTQILPDLNNGRTDIWVYYEHLNNKLPILKSLIKTFSNRDGIIFKHNGIELPGNVEQVILGWRLVFELEPNRRWKDNTTEPKEIFVTEDLDLKDWTATNTSSGFSIRVPKPTEGGDIVGKVNGVLESNWDSGQNVANGDEILLTIENIPITHKFRGWEVNGVVVESGLSYSFLATENRRIIPKVSLKARCKIHAFIPSAGEIVGTINNGAEVVWGGQQWVLEDDKITLTIKNIPPSHRFRGWEVNGVVVENGLSYSFLATENHASIIASVTQKSLVIIKVSEPTKGTMIGKKSDIVENSGWTTGIPAYEDEKITLTIQDIPSTFKFRGWYEGGKLLESNFSYTFVATTVARNIEPLVTPKETYKITIVTPPVGTVTGKVNGAETTNWTTGQSVNEDDEVSITITNIPNSDKFREWEESTAVVGTTNPLIFTATTDRTLTPKISPKNRCQVTVHLPTVGRLVGTVNGIEAQWDTKQEVAEDDEITLTIKDIPEIYKLVKWEDNGSAIGSTNPFTFTATTNHSMRAIIELKNSYTITVSVPSSGSILGQVNDVEQSDWNTGQKVLEGDEVVLRIVNADLLKWEGWMDEGHIVERGTSYVFYAVNDKTIIPKFSYDPETSVSKENLVFTKIITTPGAIQVETSETAQISCYTLMGREVLSVKNLPGSLNYYSLSRGFYFVRIHSDQGNVVEKVFVP